MRWSVAWLALSLCACKPQPTTPPGPEDPAAAARDDTAVVAIAERIDPGPQTPLLATLPAWLKEKVDGFVGQEASDEASVAAAREAITAWDKVKLGDLQSMMAGGLMLLRGVVMAERAVAAGSSDVELLAALSKTYRLIEQLAMFRNGAFFNQIYEMGIQLARKEGKLETQQIEEVMALLGKAVERAPALQLHTSARLLRQYPGHPTAIEALVRIAQADLDAERFADAVAVRRLAVHRKGERATGDDLASVAATCYRALDLACGDLYRAAAEKRGPEDPADPKKVEALQKRLTEIDGLGKDARDAAALAQAAGLADAVKRGYLLMRLGHNTEAQALFTSLRDQHPGDARPLTGLAILGIQRRMDFSAAAALTRAGRTLTGRDKAYYEVALGTLPILLLTDLMKLSTEAPDRLVPEIARAVAEVDGLVQEFKAHDPPRAAVLDLVLEIGKKAIPDGAKEPDRDSLVKAMRGASKQAMGLVERYPESPDAWRLLYLAARLTPDAAEAAAMATAQLPPALQKDPDVRLQQVRAMIDLGVQWELSPLFEAAMTSAQDLPEALDADTRLIVRATLDAIFGKGKNDPELLKKSAAAFTELAGRRTGRDKAHAHNNAGVALALTGDAQGALTALTAAREAAPDEMTPLLNMAALAEAVGQLEGVTDAFGKVASDGDNSTLRLQAHAWLVTLADAGTGDREVTRKDFHAALAKERDGEVRGNMTIARWGVISTGEFKVSLGYSSQQGLQLIDEVVPRWWLIAPARATDALLAEDAAKAKDKKGAKAPKKAKDAKAPAPATPIKAK